MANKWWYVFCLSVMLTACGTSDETQLLQEEYEALSNQKRASTEEMVQLNMAIDQAESQNDEILMELKTLEVLLAEATEHIDKLEDDTRELAEEEEALSSIVEARRDLVNGWQLYNSVAKLVAAQPDLNAELESYSQVIAVAYDRQLRLMDGTWFPHGSAANEGVSVSEGSDNRWYRLQAPYSTKADLMVWLMDAYSAEAASEVFDRWVTEEPDDVSKVLLSVDGNLYTGGFGTDQLPGTGLDMKRARFFVTEANENEAAVRMILPVMDYGDGPWTGTEKDMHFFDYVLNLTKTAYGWRLSGSEFPELY